MYFNPARASGSRMLYMSSPSTPAASRARFSFSLSARACAAAAVCSATASGTTTTPSSSASTTSPGLTSAPAQTTGMLAERRLDRAARVDRAAEHRKAHRGEIANVAHAAIDHHALAAVRAKRSREQLAEVASVAIRGTPSNDDVAVLQLLGGDVQHPVVAGLQQHGDGRTAELRAGVDRSGE